MKVHSVEGDFSVLLPEGTYQFRVGRFNGGEVKAMTYGRSKALNLPITVTRDAPAELLITLASTAPTIGVREATQVIPPAQRGTPAGGTRPAENRPSDATERSVRLSAPDEVRGQLYTDGEPPPNFQVQGLKILLTPEGGTSRLQADVNANGSFIFRNVDPNARYKVSIEGFSTGYLLAGRGPILLSLQRFQNL